MTESTDALLGFVKARPGFTVSEFAIWLSEEQGICVDEAARSIYQLWEEERIRLEDPDPPRGVVGYASSLYSLWFWILVSVVVLTTLSIYVLPQEPPYLYLRYSTGALSVLYLPGAALIEALYPKKGELEWWERLALSLGLSLTLVPLVSLVVNYTPWGIRLNPVFVSLSLLTLTLAILAVRRKFGYFMTKVDTESTLKA